MTRRYYPVREHSTCMAALYDIVKWLINNGHALTGPNWEIIEGWSAGAAALAVPTNSHDLTTFPGGWTSWRTGALTAGDWIILRTQTGVAGTKMEVYFEYESTTVVNICMLPLDNWVVATYAASPPSVGLNALHAVGAGGAFPAGLIAFGMLNWHAYYTVVADEAMMAMIADDRSMAGCSFTYIGEVTPARLTGTPADDRPYVIYDAPTAVYWPTGAYFNRLSPVDDVTVLIQGYDTHMYSAAGYPLTSGHDTNLLGLWIVLPIGVYFHDGGSRHFVGFLQNVGTSSQMKGPIGTIGNLTWMYRNNYNGISYQNITLRWDGTTEV